MDSFIRKEHFKVDLLIILRNYRITLTVAFGLYYCDLWMSVSCSVTCVFG